MTPSERAMFQNFWSQLKLADQLGFGCAWVAETHLSCQVQKKNRFAVIPHFEGEIGLNTDIFQLAHIIYGATKNLAVGSAIRNIQCNGGPIAHAEALKTFLSLKAMVGHAERGFELGFAAGRFPFSNAPYGVRPRSMLEEKAWPVLKGLIFRQATEVFLRLLKGEVIGSQNIDQKLRLTRDLFRTDQDWQSVVQSFNSLSEEEKRMHRIRTAADSEALAFDLDPVWDFEPVGVIPFEPPIESLRLTIGAHDRSTQEFANQFLPVGVFNLSITPQKQIEETHHYMARAYHKKPWGASSGVWSRDLMPRTALVFVDLDRSRAQSLAVSAVETYWRAMEGTLDPNKVKEAVGNALVGTPEDLIDQLNSAYHKEERLMLWFDFNDHDTIAVERRMKLFMDRVAPYVTGQSLNSEVSQ